jgi:hypothetical protein
MLLEGRPVGTISVARREARSFSDEQISLLRTFADQAVIAIENVRLFNALETRNAELSTPDHEFAPGSLALWIALRYRGSDACTETEPRWPARTQTAMEGSAHGTRVPRAPAPGTPSHGAACGGGAREDSAPGL